MIKDSKALNSLLHKKIEKQAVLKERNNQLNEVDIDIVGSKISRWFGTSYLTIKRLVSLLIGVLLFFISIILLVYPEIIFEDEQLRDELIEDSRSYYAEMAGETLEETLFQLSKSNPDYSIDHIMNQFNKALDKAIEKEITSSVQFLAILLLIFAFIFIYVSRSAKQMKTRNLLISQSQSITQEVIAEFQAHIEDGDKELTILQDIISGKSVDETNEEPKK